LIGQAQQAIREAMAHFSLPPEMEFWLQDGAYYMVRSSGAEDGKKTANAGGNLSCKYVTKKEIPARAGDVLASYIDKRSLLNRFKAGENPFTATLPLSLTVQELIGEAIGGEKNGDEIPISVVLFTNEPTYVGKEPFRILKLSATYGHGEGVVGNQGIPTDTAYLLQSLADPKKLYTWYENQEKGERLAPIQTETEMDLKPLPNPEELVHKPALSTDLIKRLFELGQVVEEFFGEPTDMELVIKNGIIHIVQGRPINREPTTPTYLDLEGSAIQNPQELKVLVPGNNHVLVLPSAESILVRDTLEQASDDLRKHHRLVITREDEPLNSHPIIRMTELNITCLYHPNGIDSLMGDLEEGTVLAVCPQQGLVALAKEASKLVIKEGTIAHPAPLACPKDPFPWRKKKGSIPHEVQALLKQIRMGQIGEKAAECFQSIAKEPFLSTIDAKIQYPSLLTLGQEMQRRVASTLNELGLALKRSGKLEILFFAKALEILLWGEGLSVVQLQDLSEQMSLYAEQVGKRKALFAEESLITPLMPETGKAWVDFLVTIETKHTPEESEALKKLLRSIGNTRSVWLTFFFDPARKQAKNSQELLKTLLEGFDLASQALVDHLRKTEQTIDRFKTDVFANPAGHPSALGQLLKIIQDLADSQFIEKLIRSSPLAKIISAEILAKAIDLYDRSVKITKTSSHFPLQTKAQLFQEMLRHNLSFLKTIVLKLIGENQFPRQGVSLEEYLNILSEQIERPLDTLSPQELAERLARHHTPTPVCGDG
jgi:hypothetical protein